MVCYKVVLIGESGVGKTCLMKKYDKATFNLTDTAPQPTVGSNYLSKIEEI